MLMTEKEILIVVISKNRAMRNIALILKSSKREIDKCRINKYNNIGNLYHIR